MISTALEDDLRRLHAEYELLRAQIDRAQITKEYPSDETIVTLINRSSTLRVEIDDLKKQIKRGK